MATAERTLTGVRWSSAVRCPRRAVYEHQDVPRREWTQEELDRFTRGKHLERIIKDELTEKFAAKGKDVVEEVEVAWPAADQGTGTIGTGHADLYIPAEKCVIEIVSNAAGSFPEEKMLQVAGYALNMGADSAMVVSINSHNMSAERRPVNIAGLEPRVREIEALVGDGCSGGELPGRVCRTPLDGHASMCAFREHCFAEWQWPARDELLTDGESIAELADAVDRRKKLEKEVAELKKYEDEVKAEIAVLVPLGVEASVTYQGTDFMVRHSERSSGDRFRLSECINAGHSLPVDLEPFVSHSKTSPVITVKRESK